MSLCPDFVRGCVRICVLCASILALLLGTPLARAQEEEEEQPREILARDGLAPKVRLHGFGNVDFSPDRTRTSRTAQTSSRSASSICTSPHSSRNGSPFSPKRSSNWTATTISRSTSNGCSCATPSPTHCGSPSARVHTALGYWNLTYHHGLLLQPTIRRPEALRFEDNGGILPIHNVGLAGGGRVFAGDWSFDYTANLANGRGPDRTKVQNGTDANDEKAIVVNLVGTYTDRLSVGVSFYDDDIPPDPAVPGREGTTARRFSARSWSTPTAGSRCSPSTSTSPIVTS